MPHFIRDHLSERDDNSDGGDNDYFSQDEYIEDSDELSE